MFRLLVFLALDAFFTYTLVAFGGEAGGYVFLLIAIVAWLTWEVVRAIKDLKG